MTKKSPDFVSALKKNRRPGAPRLAGLWLSWSARSAPARSRFHMGTDMAAKAHLVAGEVVDLQIDAGRKLARLIKVTAAGPRAAKGNRLVSDGGAGGLIVAFTVDPDYADLLQVEVPAKLRVIQANDEHIMFELPTKPDWRRVATEE